MYVDAQTPEGAAKQQSLVGACVIAWRLIYEGGGLSGYSKKNEKLFSFLALASMALKDDMVAVTEDGLYKSLYQAKKAGILQSCKTVSMASAMNKVMNDALDCTELPAAALKDLAYGAAFYNAYRSIERKGEEGNKLFFVPGYDAKVRESSKLFGCLRRLGQGSDPVEVQVGEEQLANIEGMPKSLVADMRTSKTKNALFNPKMKELVALATELYSEVSKQLAIREEQAAQIS